MITDSMCSILIASVIQENIIEVTMMGDKLNRKKRLV